METRQSRVRLRHARFSGQTWAEKHRFARPIGGEILSPGSVRYDRGIKKDVYERFALKEYWIVDPNNRSVEIYIMRENAFVTHGVYEAGDKAGSALLSGFELEIDVLFQSEA